MRYSYCTCALLIALAAVRPAAQAPRVETGPTTYTVFLRGMPIGREDVTVRSDASGTTVVTEGRVSAPADLVIRRAEFTYDAGWAPRSLVLDATSGGAAITVRTSIKDGTAVTEGSQAGRPITATHAISAGSIVHVNGIFGSYVALARRLAGASAGSELRLFLVPQTEIPVRVAAVHDERMQLGADFLDVRRYELVFVNPGGELPAHLTADRDGRLVSVAVPGQGISVVRADVSASTTRTQVHSNPGDEPVTIPAAGFNLGATITRPSTPPPAGGYPAVVLLSGSGANERDGHAFGVATSGQLAGALAQAGFLAVRYDKRGYGQSGGRSESATITDFAEGARAVQRWLARRDDVDDKRIALVGHSEGAWVALLAAEREKRFATVVSIAAPASTGAELVLEQQRDALELLALSPEERDRRVALQKQIQNAVLTGRGWEGVPPEMRRQADTPWFQSLLAYDPAKVIEDVRQPLLFLHGELDRQVPVEHADRLADLARKESDSESIEVVIVRGVNHLLVPTTTGDVTEYATLKDTRISADVTSAITAWLAKTFAGIR
jgi:pimeloyl-ACP methyl ester carboxylesterase